MTAGPARMVAVPSKATMPVRCRLAVSYCTSYSHTEEVTAVRFNTASRYLVVPDHAAPTSLADPYILQPSTALDKKPIDVRTALGADYA